MFDPGPTLGGHDTQRLFRCCRILRQVFAKRMDHVVVAPLFPPNPLILGVGGERRVEETVPDPLLMFCARWVVE